jgi:Fic family protein
MASFKPKYTITSMIAGTLMRIEAAREAIGHLPINAWVLATLRETARLYSTHYSTMIEGNRLTQEQVSRVVEKLEHFAGRERDEREVLGYYAGLEKVERLAQEKRPISEQHVKLLHALVMSGGSVKATPSPYRDGQNVIRDGRTNKIVYMPPEAKDVPALMKDLVGWVETSEAEGVPCPIRAGIAHYQIATIHPYYDGNGRTARLLTTLIFHLGGYDLKGLYSLEEYYARNLIAYYSALTIGPSHNYYMGRADTDITQWVDYFCQGVAESFENVKKRVQEAAKVRDPDDSSHLRRLDPRQRKALELFRRSEAITSNDVARLFAISQRMARNLLRGWVKKGFVKMLDPARRSRKYAMGSKFKSLAP